MTGPGLTPCASRITNEPLSEPALRIEDLTVAYRRGDVWLEVLRSIFLQVQAGQTCGLVGESGSGKTTLAQAVMRYLPENGAIRQGSIRFSGRDLAGLSRTQMRHLWGRSMALVPQDPLSSLNPSLRIGEQAAEVVRLNARLSPKAAQDRVLQMFDQVRLADPRRVALSYPHQLSGGMLQRVLIAMALYPEPLLLLMDEPTSSLDVTTQATILDLVRDLIAGRRTAAMYISHHLGTVAQLCDRVAVLYAGELVENASSAALYRQPLHPYTRALLDCVPRLGQNKAKGRLLPIQGRIPPLDDLPEGCIFRPRCPLAIEVCFRHPPLYEAGPDRASRCHRWQEIADGSVSARQGATFPVGAQPASPRMPGEAKSAPLAPGPRPEPGTPEEAAAPSLEVEGLEVHFPLPRTWIEVLARRRAEHVRAVNGVDLHIGQGMVVGLVGESGSGKTTLARAVVGLTPRTSGQVRLSRDRTESRSLESLERLSYEALPPGLKGRSRQARRFLQIVFQNPDEALNPYLSVGQALQRPLIRLRKMAPRHAAEVARELLEAVELPADYAARLPGQLSGGEKQRVAIARAFAPSPGLLVADEPVSSLDVSVQASILALLQNLQSQRGTSILFISHDLAVVGYLADEIAVIYLGQLMETGPAQATFDAPFHPYTEALLSAVPLIDPQARQERIRLQGELPSASAPLSGCPFHTRCPRFLGPVCVAVVPPWRTDAASGKKYFCHIPVDELRGLQQRPFAFSSERG